MTALLTTIDVETAPNPEFAVILMHGLGADANDFVPLVPSCAWATCPLCVSSFRTPPKCRLPATTVM